MAADFALPGFTGSPLDRADQLRRDPRAVEEARLHPKARFLVLRDLKPLMRHDGSDFRWVTRSAAPPGTLLFLGLAGNGEPRFAVDGGAINASGGAIDASGGAIDASGGAIDAPDGEFVDARSAGATLVGGRAAVLAQARSILAWHRQNGYCPNCSAPTVPAKAGYSRVCPNCGSEHFPRVDPVVIMLAEHAGRALVGRNARFAPAMFSALAGFVEPGESIEEAVQRELHEEAGIRVSGVRFGASQPWPFPSNLMLGAFAVAEDAELHADGSEIVEARWVTRREVRAALAGKADWRAPAPPAIAHWLLARWAAGRPF